MVREEKKDDAKSQRKVLISRPNDKYVGMHWGREKNSRGEKVIGDERRVGRKSENNLERKGAR